MTFSEKCVFQFSWKNTKIVAAMSLLKVVVFFSRHCMSCHVWENASLSEGLPKYCQDEGSFEPLMKNATRTSFMLSMFCIGLMDDKALEQLCKLAKIPRLPQVDNAHYFAQTFYSFTFAHFFKGILSKSGTGQHHIEADPASFAHLWLSHR